MTIDARRVVRIRREARDATAPSRRALRARCLEKTWRFAERNVSVVHDVEGRPLRLLSPRDLNELYRAAHRDLLVVVDTANTRTLLDPREGGRPRSRRTMRLARLIEYKALYFQHATSIEREALDNMVTQIDAHLAATAGAKLTDTDPRALPFPSFDLGAQVDADLALDSDEGRAAFERTFGPPRARRDAHSVSWELDPRGYHGRDAFHVRGRVLPAGFHWDVPGPRGGAHVATATEVWHIKRGQYINVYPDMYVRTTRQGGRRVWPQNT